MRRALVAVLAVLVLVPLAGLAALHVVLTPDWLRAHAEDAVQRATGRALTIEGPVQLAWSLTPTIVATDVSLANPPGMSRPAMAHVERIEAHLSLAKLLSREIEVSQVVVTAPDIILERDASGRPNWLFAEKPAGPPAASAPSRRERLEVVLGTVEVRNGRIAWQGGGAPFVVQVPALDVAAAAHAVRGTAVANGVPLAVSGQADPAALQLLLAGGGVEAQVTGPASQPSFNVTAPDLAAASTLAGRPLPPLHDVQVSATLSAGGLSAVRASAGAGELDGVRLTRALLEAPAMDQPVSASGEIALGRLPVAFTANAASLRALLRGGLLPIQLRLATGDAVLAGEGSVADWRGDGLQLAVTGTVPDLATLGDAAGVTVPALRDVAIQARVAAAHPGLIVRGLRLTSSAGDLAGDLAVGLAPRPSVRGSLVAQRLDLDALALHAPPLSPLPLSPPPSPAAVPPTPAAAPAPPVIPATKLPLDALRRFDADLRLDAGEALWRGISFRAIGTRLTVADGTLRLDPLSLQGPGGPIRAQLTAQAEPASVALSAQAPGLAAGPVLAAFGAPGFSSGTVDLDVQLQGNGDTLRALAATLDGHFGVAMVDGEVDNRWLADLLAEALRAANLPADRAGTSHVRCAALRADVENGMVRVSALALDTTKLALDGMGTVNLANETLDLHLRPLLRLGAILAVPVRVGGTLRSPKVALDSGVLGPGRVGLTIGGPPAADTCGPALALARDGHPGPPPSAPEPSKPMRPADLLRSLLR